MHAWRTGLSKPNAGEASGNNKLCDRDIQVIRSAAARGVTGRIIANVYGVTEANVSAIIRFKTWTHIQHERETA